MSYLSISTEDSEDKEKSGTNNPFLFIVGSPRSGTTLLKRMIDAHPEIAVTRETHWITRYYKRRIGITNDDKTTEELVARLFEYHRLPHLGLGQKEIESLINPDDPQSYSEFVTAIFNLYGKKQSKPLVGDKTPGYVRNIPLLHNLWPNAKFIHLIRDGREVCLSMLNWRLNETTVGKFTTWPDNPIATIALWWKWHVQLGVEAGNELDSKVYFEIKYDDLITKQEQSCIEICKYLGVDYADTMLNFAKGKTIKNTHLSANSSWLPPTKGLRNWQSQMPHEDCEAFEAVAGEFLEEIGFSRFFPAISKSAKKRAHKTYQIFTQDMHNREIQLPKDW